MQVAKMLALGAGLTALLVPALATAGPEDDRQAFVAYYASRFPGVPFQEYANGIYAIDEDARAQWESIESFPPYEFAVDHGALLWEESLADGKTYSDCFGGDAETVGVCLEW